MELFSPMHLLIVLAIVLLVFGPRNLPELGKGLGAAIHGFKTAVKPDEPTSAPDATDDSGLPRPPLR